MRPMPIAMVFTTPLNFSSGACTLVPRFCCAWVKVGVSCSFKRSHSATAPIGNASRKGIRQPQSCNCSGVKSAANSATSPAPANSPKATVSDCQAPNRPRFPFGANSVISETAPPNSPPANSPWNMRNRVSNSGAATPMEA
ncbi:hypothetical protein D3C71_1309880 [compost metagenome]